MPLETKHPHYPQGPVDNFGIEQVFRGYGVLGGDANMGFRYLEKLSARGHALGKQLLETELESVWEQSLGLVRNQLSTQTFKTWFDRTRPISVNGEVVTIATPNLFTKEWLEDRYIPIIQKAISEITGNTATVRLVVEDSQTPDINDDPQEPTRSESPRRVEVDDEHIHEMAESSVKNLNPKYYFESFVIGASNRFAHAAALAVAEKPANAYNPLFIYGGVGLGKTHLLHAIGHYVSEHTPHLRVRYVSSEKFTNDFINSIRDKDKIAGFQRQYRNIDVLLIDDIQFLENKEATQEEFFHTFNTLHGANKQIVICSDRPPKEIATLEDRLRSRFEWGLITDVQTPDLETRIAILRKKAQSEQLSIPNNVLEFIASRIQSNIRELEGALIRVLAFSSLTNQSMDLALAEDVLRSLIPDQAMRPIDIDLIQQEACQFYGVKHEDLLGPKRSQNIVYPRQIAMYLTREMTDCSLPAIGRKFGKRDHTTVMHACKRIEKLISERRETYNEIQTLTSSIKRMATMGPGA